MSSMGRLPYIIKLFCLSAMPVFFQMWALVTAINITKIDLYYEKD